ncbi:DNA polymerase III subunit gamma/tau [Desulfovibrio desulfuricans]|uniref:DNA polymerase III subunit gamma/tau n=1 Tax=Desulfovibrio desulfuricans TaxID=876 RepID=UPI001783D165|nr:DNA polymerase III subunit gamma/tau [Desulfovibrio desulfuricans]MBD8895492.1 DNA polymerase III subunit gamma/tau [Desulfovibrio desulfuricans]
MKHLSLAARYRPQNFAQVAGQDMVKAVLSRAAAEDRPAAAYLLSGTRGVGKTTIARIFAKALNCQHAPGPEPCNQCEQCRKITQGVHVDVTEIDGASNNSVEDARSLRETIGYAPMEGRYKIFIIDEAHMLTRNAFNALLKTLEEPPERVVFIFATTEAHKFPITIVSRCQHFVFRHLSEDALFAHLTAVLRKENAAFEEGAVRLIARRAAGSVRDSMSLLDQTLALGGEELTVAATRQVLGLAGQELFAELFTALQGQDCAAVANLCGQILQQGVDIGFFMRELAGNLRNLFLLRQSGQAIVPSLRLPADEAALWQGIAPQFSAAHLHAAWQMALDAQRGIVQSPEPAAALELLLLNLALLPQLLPVGQATPGPGGQAGGAGQSSVQAPSQAAAQGSQQQAQAVPPSAQRMESSAGMPAGSAQVAQSRPRDAATGQHAANDADDAESDEPDAAQSFAAPTHRPWRPGAQTGAAQPDLGSTDLAISDMGRPNQGSPGQKALRQEDSGSRNFGQDDSGQNGDGSSNSDQPDSGASVADGQGFNRGGAGTPGQGKQEGQAACNWTAFCDFCSSWQGAGRDMPRQHLLRSVSATWADGILRLAPKAETQLFQLERGREELTAALAAYGAGQTQLELVAPRPYRPEAELIEEFSQRPELQPCLEVLNARVKGCRPVDQDNR